MFGLTPFRKGQREHLWDDFPTSLPQVMDDFFNWPTQLHAGFKVDIKETASNYIVQAELPGVAKDNIQIELNNGYLTIKVNSDDIKEEQGETYIRKERRMASSQRSFYVGEVSPNSIKAKHNHGILEITVPKQDTEQTNRYNIDIQ